MSRPFLPLKVQSDIEQQKSWEGISTPSELARYIARVLAVDPNELNSFNEVTYSSIEPTGEDKNSIWVKTTEPFAIGIPTSVGYKLFYQQPPNVPYLFIGNLDQLPSYARALTETELEKYELKAPATNVANWAIINL